MIPKIIHYCWFGGKKKPEKIQKCIDSWYKFLPDYMFIEWNEDTFDINYNQYTKDAYEAKKYAFVSDVARVKALQEHGGIYMDTDVEVLKSFNDILDNRCVFGFEEKGFIATSFMGCEPNHPIIKTFLNEYKDLRFYNIDGSINTTTNVTKLTNILVNKGLILKNEKLYLQDGIVVYPQEYFSPYDYINCLHQSTKKTYCVHYFHVTWMPWNIRLKRKIKSIVVKIIGKNNMNSLRAIIKSK